MTLSRYTNDAADPGRSNVSPEDARTFRKLADAAEEQGVRDPEYVAARAAVEVSITDAATATVAAAEAMGRSAPRWARAELRGGDGE
jgi:predicted Zn-dependent protease